MNKNIQIALGDSKNLSMLLRQPLKRILLTFSVVLLALFVSVHKTAVAQEDFKRLAQQQISTGNYEDALATITQAHENGTADVESYQLLARVYLSLGSGIPAESAIERARQLGADYASTAVSYAKSLLIQGKYNDALLALRGIIIPEIDQRDALIITGDAYFADGNYANAIRSYEEAKTQFPEDYQAYLGLARIALKQSRLDDAKQFADQAYERDDRNTMVQYTRGLLARYRGDVELAETFMLDAVRLFPGNLMANLELAGIRINQNRLEDAEKYLDSVYASSPKNPMALYLSGVILASRGEYTDADALLKRTRAVTENYLPALYVRGLVAYQLENLDDAITLLSRVLQARPANRQARLALAGAFLKRQQPTSAYNVIRPLLEQEPDNVNILAMGAAILMASGEIERGKLMYEKLSTLQTDTRAPTVNNLATKVALAQFVAGETENALSTLSVVTAGRESQIKDLGVLGSMQLRTEDYIGAEATIAKIITTAPDRALGYNMRGTLEFKQRQFERAVQSFTQALSRDENYYTALRNRGLAYLNLRQYGQAESDLKELLELEPNDVRAKAALGKALLENDKAEEAVPYFREAVRYVRGSVILWADYAQALADSGNTTRAIEEARATAVRGEDQPEILKRMGLLLLEMGQSAAAERPLSRYAAFKSDEGEAHLFHARALLQTGLYTGARISFLRAMRAEKATVDADVVNWYLFATEALGQKLEEAERRLPSLVTAKRPVDVKASLVGDVFLGKGEPELAAASYREALGRNQTPDLIIGLSRALFLMGQPSDTIQTLESFIQRNPEARQVRLELALRYEQSLSFQEASEQYEYILRSGVADASVVAKLAMIYLQLQNRASTQLADRAYLMAPDDPAILDIAGWIALQAEKRTSKAVDLLEKAARRAPGEALYKYHLGVAYVARGDRRDAIRVLTQALSLDPNFVGAVDARRQLLNLQ
ncbi:XrtA/PEP-CTERM system TPR-repeat protein PrsT [Kordiimonas aquimaris]|uniref:XrtA/PEP-CTERM system TPR-repeat protein PrsT n=1 Tax=Kordiimonas aquimaris TaxID=707591 RepID=UPI0021CF8896|nr:XrtA/PEP-CTERM system TPR-repeat protein PrsT [Kordiimonas aquimaris]